MGPLSSVHPHDTHHAPRNTHAAAQSGAREYLSEGFDVDFVELLAGLDLGQQRSVPTGHTARSQRSEEEEERTT